MTSFFKTLFYGVMALIVLVVALFLFGPYENSDLSTAFDETEMQAGVSAYFTAQEARFDDITPGTEKRVIWYDVPEARTDIAVLYIHGFSATAQEIRPVPDLVADGLGANLVYTRLAGHGRSGEALAEARVADWLQDVAEGLAAARMVGDRVVILSTSTGGTLAAAVAVDDRLSQDVAGIVFVSPNFGINNPLAPLLTFPAARYWLPMLAGHERSFEPHNAQQGVFWTTRYPSVATLPMAALVREVVGLDLSATDIPALFMFSKDDTVVVPEKTAEVAARWGGDAVILHPDLGPEDDPDAHVIAGDIMSPGQTQSAANRMIEWIRGL